MKKIFELLKTITVLSFFIGTFANAEATPPEGESLLSWHFGITPTLDLTAFNSTAGYDDGSGANGGYPFDANSLIPTKHTDTADYKISDWFGGWDKDFGYTNIAGLYPSGGEWYDVEALYLDNDEDYIYVAMITSAPFKDTSISGNDANKTIGIVDPRLDSTTAFIRPGDLSISLFKEGTARNERDGTTWSYNYGLNLIDEVRPNNDNTNEYDVGGFKTQYMRSETLQKGLYATTSDLPDTADDIVYPDIGDWYTGSRRGHVDAYYELTHFDPSEDSSQFSGSYKGDATYVNYYRYSFPSGHEENDAQTWVIEAIIPKSLFGTDITGEAQQAMAIRWTMGCRNDGASEGEGGPFPIIQLKATLDKKDWGDLPDADGVGNSNGADYNTDSVGTMGASHVIVDNLYMGSIVDKELDGQSSVLATGDDDVDGDDEDGVVFPTLIAGRNADINVTVFNNLGKDATLYWFIDFNGDGDFEDASEAGRQTVNSLSTPQELNLTIAVPYDANIDNLLGARFRLSTDSNLTADGAAKDGEVEDYLIEVVTKLSIGSLIWEDLDADGLQDDGEPGIKDVNVTLLDAHGVEMNAPAMITTLADGKYYFSGLEEGNYSVRVTLPLDSSYVPCRTQTTVEDDSESDSNIAQSSGNEYTSASFVLQAHTEPTETEGKVGDDQDDTDEDNGNMTVDFCFYRPASLGDYVWYDENKDGIQDSTEQGVKDVEVKLFKDCGDSLESLVGTTRTSEDGLYRFGGLDAGNYCVEFLVPSDMLATSQNSGSSDKDSDASTTDPYRTSTITLDWGENDMQWDMGMYSDKASVGNFVWYDLNHNGVQESGEEGVEGIDVRLLDESCTHEVNRTSTDNNGLYMFNNLNPDTYCIEFGTIPDGYAITLKNSATDTTDSDVNASNHQTGTITLEEGESDLSWDMGIYPLATIGDRVWYDDNQDGLQSTGEGGVAGVTVKLLKNCDTEVDSNITDGNGNYLFTGVEPADYCVVFSNLPDDYIVTTQNSGANDDLDSDADRGTYTTTTTTLSVGEEDRSWDMGIYSNKASIGDRVWYDSNENGIQESTESGVEGVKVILYQSDCNTSVTGISPLTTDASGNYRFSNLTPADYCVGFDLSTLPVGYVVTDANIGDDNNDSDADPSTGKTQTTTLEDAQVDLSWDMGIHRSSNSAIGNRVWHDRNANGVQDANESGVADINVTLYQDCGRGESEIGSVKTDANGMYRFENLYAGDYCLEFTNLPLGANITPQDQGDDRNDSDVDPATGRTIQTNLASSEEDMSWDMGIYYLGGLGDKVWEDSDRDGIQDAAEQGVEDINVTLYSPDCSTDLESTQTDENGSYYFRNVMPGSYCIGFSNLPTDYVSTVQDQGDDNNDSDTNGDFQITNITLSSQENNISLDMGIHKKVVASTPPPTTSTTTQPTTTVTPETSTPPTHEETTTPQEDEETPTSSSSEETEDEETQTPVEEGGLFRVTDDEVQANTQGSVTTIPVLENDDREGTIHLVSIEEGETLWNSGTAVAGTSLETTDELYVEGEGTWRVEGGTIVFTAEDGFEGVPTPIYYLVADENGNSSNIAQVRINSSCVCEPYELTAKEAVPALNGIGVLMLMALFSLLGSLLIRKEV